MLSVMGLQLPWAGLGGRLPHPSAPGLTRVLAGGYSRGAVGGACPWTREGGGGQSASAPAATPARASCQALGLSAAPSPPRRAGRKEAEVGRCVCVLRTGLRRLCWEGRPGCSGGRRGPELGAGRAGPRAGEGGRGAVAGGGRPPAPPRPPGRHLGRGRTGRADQRRGTDLEGTVGLWGWGCRGEGRGLSGPASPPPGRDGEAEAGRGHPRGSGRVWRGSANGWGFPVSVL